MIAYIPGSDDEISNITTQKPLSETNNGHRNVITMYHSSIINIEMYNIRIIMLINIYRTALVKE